MSPSQDDGVSGRPQFEAGRFGLLEQIHVATIRLDSKVDGIAGELRHLRDEHKDDHADHENRLRTIEATPKVSVADFEALKARPYVAPATVWKIVSTILGICGLAATIIIAIAKN